MDVASQLAMQLDAGGGVAQPRTQLPLGASDVQSRVHASGAN
jgi:hypothetical protein